MFSNTARRATCKRSQDAYRAPTRKAARSLRRLRLVRTTASGAARRLPSPNPTPRRQQCGGSRPAGSRSNPRQRTTHQQFYARGHLHALAIVRGRPYTGRLVRRRGRVAEGGALLKRYTGQTVSRVRIPPSPPAPLAQIAGQRRTAVTAGPSDSGRPRCGATRSNPAVAVHSSNRSPVVRDRDGRNGEIRPMTTIARPGRPVRQPRGCSGRSRLRNSQTAGGD